MRYRVLAVVFAALASAFAAASACGGGAKTPPCPNPLDPTCTATTTTTTTSTPVPTTAIFVGAGDIGWCGSEGAIGTGRLLDGMMDATVYTTGDNAYPRGSARDFLTCYEPVWGRHKARTRPSPGNHDYETLDASAYFDYFGDNAGFGRDGYYSYDLGAWHILSLNSNVPANAGSAQYAFVARDLQTRPSPCTLAYWHHPLFSSGPNGNNRFMADMFRLLYNNNVDVVVNGHDHWYERFDPQDADGRSDTARGIRQFTVGTGGAPLYGETSRQQNSVVRISAYGVLKFTLRDGNYDYQFMTVPGGPAGDLSTGRCH